MKRRSLIGFAVLVVVIPVAALQVVNRRAKADFEEQLRLARAEGMVTNAAEFRALIPPANDSENAALIYRTLQRRITSKTDIGKLADAVSYRGTPADLTRANQLLEERAEVLKDLDAAVERPRCWFDRHWEDGAAVLMPELAAMKAGARLLLLRASVAARKGHVSAALEDVERTRKLAVHAREDPGGIPSLVGQAIDNLAIRSLAAWSFTYRHEPKYSSSLRVFVANIPRPNLQRENLGRLLEILSMIELCNTDEGRLKLGLTDENISKLEYAARFMNPFGAKAKIVSAERDLWKALATPENDLETKARNAGRKASQGLLAFPTAANIYRTLGGDYESVTIRLPSYHAMSHLHEVLARALSTPKIPKTIDTSTFLSPFDQKPLSYSFDGKQIVISTSQPGAEDGMRTLKVPPDSVLAGR